MNGQPQGTAFEDIWAEVSRVRVRVTVRIGVRVRVRVRVKVAYSASGPRSTTPPHLTLALALT